MEKKTMNIVVVDDEVDIFNLFSVIFQNEIKENKYRFYFFENGKECIDFLESNNNAVKITTILSDINMPVMDGYALLDLIKKNFPEIIVLLLSGFTDFEYVREGLNSGASGYIQKSKIEEELQQMLPKIY